MKNKPSETVVEGKWRPNVSRVIVVLILFGTVFHTLGQSSKKPPQKETSTTGYLNKAAPSGLRFALPPKPPVAYLPPLPITYDPQPVYNPEFAQPVIDVPRLSTTNAPPPPPPQVSRVPWPEAVTNFPTNKPVQIPPTPVELGAVSPQMLVRFFQNGKPADVQMLMTDPVNFQVPVREERRSSSATYEVK